MGLSSAIPALPVQDIDAAVASYSAKFGFTVVHADDGFAKLVRDDAEIHLWASSDQTWRDREDFASNPVCSGAESFIAGTASCRIQVDDVDALYAELSLVGVLHPAEDGSAVDTDWGTREFATLDLEGNLLTFFAHRTS